MSYGTEFTADAYISREHYERIEDVKEEIEEIKELLRREKTDLLTLVTATPRDVSPTDEEPFRYVTREAHSLLEDMLENKDRLVMLELLLENFDTRELV